MRPATGSGPKKKTQEGTLQGFNQDGRKASYTREVNLANGKGGGPNYHFIREAGNPKRPSRNHPQGKTFNASVKCPRKVTVRALSEVLAGVLKLRMWGKKTKKPNK